MGAYVDALKFAGGSFSLMPRRAVQELVDLCHDFDVLVSTGGFIEYVLTQGPDALRGPQRIRARVSRLRPRREPSRRSCMTVCHSGVVRKSTDACAG